MEVCDYCAKPILKHRLTWVEKFICAATHSSPAEYDQVPMHKDCAALVQSKDYAAHLDEQESLQGYSDEEKERTA